MLNPGSGRGPDGELYLLPRLVAAGNVSRVGLAMIDRPTGCRPASSASASCWSRTGVGSAEPRNAGVEDPRVTWIEALGRARDDLRRLRSAGPAHRRWPPRPTCAPGRGSARCCSATTTTLDVDLNLFHNKDTVVLPRAGHRAGRDREPGRAAPADVGSGRDPARPRPPRPPAGLPETAGQHLDLLRAAGRRRRPTRRPLTLWRGHRFLAGPEYPYEELKIGGGPPPLRVPEGWLVLHHGVTGLIDPGLRPAAARHYAAGAMILDADRAVARCSAGAPSRCCSPRRARSGRHRAQRGLPHRHRSDRRRALRLLRHGRLPDRGRPTGRRN